MTTWYYKEYKAWLDSGCPENETVIELSLNNNNLTSIPPEIGKLRSLIYIWLNNNNLVSIPPEIGQLRNLTCLLLNNNNLTSIPPEIRQLTNLEQLFLECNNLISIPSEMGQVRSLTYLSLKNNLLTSIPYEIGQLGNLTILHLSRNNLTSIPPEIGQLRNLTNLSLENNPIEHIPLNVARILERQRRVLQGVYADAQSVHNATIQQTLRETMMRLLNEKITDNDVIPLVLSDLVLTPFAKESLIEYSRDDSIHTGLNVSFSDVLIIVWNRIMVSPHSEEIKAVLNTEMTDAECKCFTGRISRLVNCLNGFDELVIIKISDNEQIGNVISVVKTKLEEANEYTVERHKAEAGKRLHELGVKDEEIAIWMEYIE